MRTIKVMLIAVFAALMTACASVPMGDPAQDAALKTFAAPKPGMAGVYVYRNETLGAAVRIHLALDGQSLGQSASKVYFYRDIAPGKHTVVSHAENADTLEFEAVAGRLYYVWQEVKMGLFAPRTRLQMVSEAEGKKGVGESALAK